MIRFSIEKKVRIALPAFLAFPAFLAAAAALPALAAETAARVEVPRSSARLSQPEILAVVRDFRDRLADDPDLYYLVTPPGGATEEEKTEVENEITYFLSRLQKDPTLDFPSKWLRELKEYELTPAEWQTIESHFDAALAVSPFSGSARASLADRFRSLRTQVLSLG